MSSIWNKAMYFLGLDDESRELDEAEYAPPQPQPQQHSQPQPQSQPEPPPLPVQPPPRGRRVEPPAGTRWRPAGPEARVESVGLNQDTGVRAIPGHEPRVEIVVAATFDDAQQLADHLRVRRPVVLDLRDTEPDTVRRLVDFASGITYALDGTMQKVGQGVILVAPARTMLSESEVRRLIDLGLYQAES